ncbi:MAG: Spx/MgsR family RNA polymerase-binding regulatory protein, partial [Bacilli bacterium]|nr:Spx/MgsR family RNA polymerase-binding regulatory protein [Bacilli bacterium]
MNLFLWYPNCSTCKKAKDFLDRNKIIYQERNIKEEPPTDLEIQCWLEKYSIDLKRLWNTSGILYREKNLKNLLPTMTEEEKIKLLASNGMLVKRPILI